MDYFKKIKTYIERATKLRERANEIRLAMKALNDYGLYDQAQVEDSMDRISRAKELANDCERRAARLFYDARHETYNKARRQIRDTYRKTF